MTDLDILNQVSLFYERLSGLLNKKIDEANLDLEDVQVRSVITAMFDVMDWRNTTRLKLCEQALGAVRSKAPRKQLETIIKEVESCCENPIGRFETIIWDMGLDLDDEQVIAAVNIVHEVLNHAQEDECDDLNLALLPKRQENPAD